MAARRSSPGHRLLAGGARGARGDRDPVAQLGVLQRVLPAAGSHCPGGPGPRGPSAARSAAGSANNLQPKCSQGKWKISENGPAIVRRYCLDSLEESRPPTSCEESAWRSPLGPIGARLHPMGPSAPSPDRAPRPPRPPRRARGEPARDQDGGREGRGRARGRAESAIRPLMHCFMSY